MSFYWLGMKPRGFFSHIIGSNLVCESPQSCQLSFNIKLLVISLGQENRLSERLAKLIINQHESLSKSLK